MCGPVPHDSEPEMVVWCFYLEAWDLRRARSWSRRQERADNRSYVFTLKAEVGILQGRSEMEHGAKPPPAHWSNSSLERLTWGDSSPCWCKGVFLHALSPFPVLLNQREESHTPVLAKAMHQNGMLLPKQTRIPSLAEQGSFMWTSIVYQP